MHAHTETHKAPCIRPHECKHWSTREIIACKELAHLSACLHRIRGNGEVIRRDEFEQRKEAAEQARQARLNKKPKKLASQGKDVEGFPLLQVSQMAAFKRTKLMHQLLSGTS